VVSAGQLRVLDAGCGRQFFVDYPGLGLREGKAYVVGIDVSQAALDRNEQVDEKILGDIQRYPLEPSSFDAVVCQDVLEHLPEPIKALENMTRALRPGGELFLSWSNPASLKGLVTKFTPLRFHVLAYRRFFGHSYAGQPGYPPFKTYLRWSIRPKALHRRLQRLGFEEVFIQTSEPPNLAAFWSRHPWLARTLAVWPQARLSECQVRARKR
jgi:SAM-dependent methyltransferase